MHAFSLQMLSRSLSEIRKKYIAAAKARTFSLEKELVLTPKNFLLSWEESLKPLLSVVLLKAKHVSAVQNLSKHGRNWW